MSDSDAFADQLADAVTHVIADAVRYDVPAAILAAAAEPDCDCDAVAIPHIHVRPEHVADALAHADDDPTADTAY